MPRTTTLQKVLLISLLVLWSTSQASFVRAHVTAVQTTTAQALQTWHVATYGSDITGDGSEANPFATVQHGIDVASNGDTVLVHPGVYKENINFKGKNIIVASLLVTTGDEGYILQTVIDGRRNDHVVTFANGEAATARLSGFTITNGYGHGTSSPGYHGGGVFCLNSNPTLTHLKVSGNEAAQEGGGLYFGHCSSTIQDVIVTNNLAGSGGGGIRYSYGSVSLENVVVAHNSARGRGAGAGIHFYHADGTVRNALVADNSGGAKGGGLFFDGCSPTFMNVTVVGNWTAGHGGGLNVSYMSQPTLVNSIVWGNSPEQIYFDTDWWGEAVTIEYSDLQGGEAGIVTNGHGPVYWGNGNLDTSPRFVHAGLGNYRLADTSPCIGAGKAAGAPITDIEDNPRPNPAGSNPDMGAYEHPFGSPETPSTFKLYLPVVSKATPFEWLVTPGVALRTSRSWHTATRLADGRILLVGGSGAPDQHLADVELYDPAIGQTSRVAPLHTPRHDHSATLLPDGRVLVVGGYSLPQQWLHDAEVYDPATDTWTVVPPRYSHGVSHSATLMKDGRILVVGGAVACCLGTERVEIFNPQTNAWTEARPLEFQRGGHTAQLLDDGRVLVAGGDSEQGVPLTGGDALLYDPQTDTWTATGPMVKPRYFGQSARLPDGRVLVAGGLALEDKPIPKISTSAEIYDPISNTWTAAADLAQARCRYDLVLLPGGQVLAVGGARDWYWTENSFVREIERYDPVANEWRIVGELPRPRTGASATLLPDGRVWLAGGRTDTTYFSDTWLIGPRTTIRGDRGQPSGTAQQ